MRQAAAHPPPPLLVGAPPLPLAEGADAPTPKPVGPPQATYLTPEQFAGMVQVSTKSVYRWAATDPTLPCLRLGGTIRFPR